MLIPINVDVPISRLPIVNWLLIGGICTVTIAAWNDEKLFDRLAGISYVHMTNVPAGDEEKARIMNELAEAFGGKAPYYWGPQPVFDPPRAKLPLLALSSSLLHADVLHLVGNMLFLFVFGNAINYKFGHVGFLLLYATSAIAAGLAFYATSPQTSLVGASGAIMGLVGAFLVYFPRNDVFVIHPFSVVYGAIRVPSIVMIIFWFLWDVCFWWISDEPRIAYMAHIAGFLTGFAIAMILAATRWLPPAASEQTLIDAIRGD